MLIEVLRWPAVWCPRLAGWRLLGVGDLAHHVRLLGAGHDAPALDPLARPVVDAVAPGLVELDAVGRVGREQGRRRAVEQPRHVVGVRRVAAQDPVVAQAPELARLDVRLLGRLGHLVGVGQPGLRLAGRRGRRAARAGPASSTVTSARSAFSFSSSRPAIAPIGSRVARTSASSSGSRSTYRTGTVGSPRDRASATRAWPSTTKPGAPVDEDLLDPADRVERAGERVLLRLRVDPPVRRVGQELVGRLLAGAGDPVAPARRGAATAVFAVIGRPPIFGLASSRRQRDGCRPDARRASDHARSRRWPLDDRSPRRTEAPRSDARCREARRHPRRGCEP